MIKILEDMQGSLEPTNEECERVKKLMASRTERVGKSQKHPTSITIVTGEDLKGKVSPSFINRSIEIQGVLYRPRHHTPTGIVLYRADKSEWIGKENILCIGAFDAEVVKFKSAADCQKAIKAIEIYNKYYQSNFNAPVKSTEGLGRLIGEEDRKINEARQNIADEVIEKRFEKVRREITEKRAHVMNEFMKEVASDYESKAREIHIMLAKSEVETDTLEKVMKALKEGERVISDDGVSLGLFEGLSRTAPDDGSCGGAGMSLNEE